jgi:hypothetical protein
MIRSLQVRLEISCQATDEAEITGHLGIAPSRIATSEALFLQPDKTYAPHPFYWWVLDSPQAEGELGSRLSALADVIEPFGHRLATLNPRFHPVIRVLHRSHVEEAEIIEFRFTSAMMGRFAALNLAIGYDGVIIDSVAAGRLTRR